jgi:predicted RNase H-like nuclease (RuvC/YqgF family)
MCCITFVQATQSPKTVPKNMLTQHQLQIYIQQTNAELANARREIKNLYEEYQTLTDKLMIAKTERDNNEQEMESKNETLADELKQAQDTIIENQSSIDAILNDLQNTKKELANSMIANETLRSTLAENHKKTKDSIKDGDLVPITPDIIPARLINSNRLTIKNEYTDRSCDVVVVNVLVSENGEVLDTKLLQGLFGHGEQIDKANEACVEQAKRLIFNPAQTADGKIRVRVWQGVGIMLN